MAIRKFRPYTPGTRTRVVTDFSEVTGRKPEKTLVVSKHRKKAATTEVSSPVATAVVATSGCTASWISAVTNTALPRRWPQSTTTPIAMRDWPCCFTPMAKSATSLLQQELRLAKPLCLVQKLRSKTATQCRFHQFPLVRVCIASSFMPVAVDKWFGPRALALK